MLITLPCRLSLFLEIRRLIGLVIRSGPSIRALGLTFCTFLLLVSFSLIIPGSLFLQLCHSIFDTNISFYTSGHCSRRTSATFIARAMFGRNISIICLNLSSSVLTINGHSRENCSNLFTASTTVMLPYLRLRNSSCWAHNIAEL